MDRLDLSINRAVDNLLENKNIKAISTMCERIKEISIFELITPPIEELKKEALRWSQLSTRNNNNDYSSKHIELHNRSVILHSDGSRIRAYYPSGFIEYKHLFRAYSGSTNISNIHEADKIVKEFAMANDIWPMAPEGSIQQDDLRFIKSQGSMLNNLKSETVVNNVIIGYKRFTNGIQWLGPGSKMTAMIEDREVVAFNRNWRSLLSEQTIVPILPIEKVLKEILSSILSSANFKNNIYVEDIAFDRAEFGYYSANRNKHQKYLQPAYIFSYYVRQDAGATSIRNVRFVNAYLALEKSFEKIIDDPLNEEQARRILNVGIK